MNALRISKAVHNDISRNWQALLKLQQEMLIKAHMLSVLQTSNILIKGDIFECSFKMQFN